MNMEEMGGVVATALQPSRRGCLLCGRQVGVNPASNFVCGDVSDVVISY